MLVVEDETAIRDMIAFALKRAGIAPMLAEDARAAQMAIADRLPDLILLDWMLPGSSGLELARRLRREDLTREIPIIMLTARGEAADRVLGLEIGADDYVVKPFDPRELVARIRSLQRRVAGSNDAAGDTLDADEIRFNDWRLNRVTRQLTDPAGMLIPLSNAEFRLLWVFIERPRRLLTRDQLLDAARGRAAEAFDRSIDLLVSRLRQKLNDDPKAPRLLKTVRGEGYMFDARVSK